MPLPNVHPRTPPGFADARPMPGRVWSAGPGRWAAQQRVVLVAAALVLAGHALLLSGQTARPGQGHRGDGAVPLTLQRVVQAVRTVRTVAVKPAQGGGAAGGATDGATGGATDGAIGDAIDAATDGATTPSGMAQPRRAVQASPTAKPSAGDRAPTLTAAAPGSLSLSDVLSATLSAPLPAQRPTSTSGPDADAQSDAAASPAALPADPAEPGGLRVPTYATQLPPSTTLQFALRRGTATGRAELVWQTDNGRYQLSMRGQVLASPQLAWRSEGTLDAHGIAPDRYAEWRRGREMRAANFQRGAGASASASASAIASASAERITFSGPQAQYPLLAGAQDRISWMLQLPAVLAANPALQVPGSTVQLFVAGARGDADVWTFTVQGMEAVTLADGSSTSALHLQRAPRRPYDTQADVWLDPARGHLPVRALLTVRPTGDATEFVLERQPAP